MVKIVGLWMCLALSAAITSASTSASAGEVQAPSPVDAAGTHPVPQDAAPKPTGAAAAEQLVSAGKAAMQQVAAEPKLSVVAAVAFSKAITYYETAGDVDKVCDLEANIFWCKKRMSPEDIKAFVDQKQGDQSITDALAKADAVVAKEIPASEANGYLERAAKYAKDHPDDFEQISVRYFEVAERFVGTEVSLSAQKSSMEAQHQQLKQLQAAKETARQTLFTRSAALAANAGHLASPPTPAALRAAVAAVRKLFKDDYAKTTLHQKDQLAIKLLAQVPANKDESAFQYALLTESIELSIGSGDWYTAFTAADAMAQGFAGVDAKAKKKEIFAKAHSNPVVQAILKLLDLPDDADANALVGKYFCLEAGNWDIGIPLLAHGSDAELKAIAELEMQRPDGATQQVEIADRWSALSKKAKPGPLEKLLARAVLWYATAEPSLTGITKERVAQRIDEIYHIVPEPNVDYAHISAKQWDRLNARSIDVSAANQINDIGLTLTKGVKVRIVPHPTDTWTMHYENWHWNNNLQGVFDTNAWGTTKQGDHRWMTGVSSVFIGAMMVAIGPQGTPDQPGEISGEGKVLVGPFLPSGGTGAGKIRIKVVVLGED
jgi:hypothetical protein